MNEFAAKVQKNERKIVLITCSTLLLALIVLLSIGIYAYAKDNVQLFTYVVIADVIVHIPVLMIFGMLFWSTKKNVQDETISTNP